MIYRIMKHCSSFPVWLTDDPKEAEQASKAGCYVTAVNDNFVKI